jgi:hypothetical protein
MCPALITPRTEESTKASTRGRLSFLDVSGGRIASENPDASFFLALGKFRSRTVRDPVLNKIDALLTRQAATVNRSRESSSNPVVPHRSESFMPGSRLSVTAFDADLLMTPIY